jgi:phage-related holin
MKLLKIQEFHVIPKGLSNYVKLLIFSSNYMKLLKLLENFTHIYWFHFIDKMYNKSACLQQLIKCFNDLYKSP